MFMLPTVLKVINLDSTTFLKRRVDYERGGMQLALSGAQPLFTLGLLMFALSPVNFLSLVWSPSTDIEILYFC